MKATTPYLRYQKWILEKTNWLLINIEKNIAKISNVDLVSNLVQQSVLELHLKWVAYQVSQSK